MTLRRGYLGPHNYHLPAYWNDWYWLSAEMKRFDGNPGHEMIVNSDPSHK